MPATFPANLTRSEARARAALVETEHYRVVVDLTGRGEADPAATFVSSADITFSARDDGRTHVDLVATEVLAASLDGEDLDTTGFDGTRLAVPVTAGSHVLHVSARYRYSRSGEGLHRFVDPADDRTYLYTQFEVADARRVFACFEQPDLKARFRTSVVAPRHWTVVSNGAEQHRGDVGESWARWDFAETLPISTYLTAVVAGDYVAVPARLQSAGGELAAALYCRRSLLDHLDSDRVLATTQAGFAVFEKQFGVPYPFGKYDQVFVPEYNGGAMENVGCVTFRDDYLFRSRVTEAAYEARDNTILHELSHMWFGDLVTMRWWDDLWLKESFAEFASHFSLAQTGPDPDRPWANFANSRKTWAYRADQLPSTHPVAADMVDLEAVELNFDGITYAKGASVLRQLVAFVGLDGFLAGVRSYFADHAYGNTELSDLLAALQRSSGRDLGGWSAAWLEQPGVNTLRVRVDPGGEVLGDVVVEQSAPAAWPTLRDHRVAIGLYALRDGRLERTHRVEVDVSGARTTVTALAGLPRPDLLLLNDDDLTYAKVRLDDRSLATLLAHLPGLASPLSRAVAWGLAWDMCRDGELAAGDYVDLALRGVGTETDPAAVQAVLAQALTAATGYTAPAATATVLTRWEAGLWSLLDAAAPGSDHQVALAKACASAATTDSGTARLQGWLAGTGVPDGLPVDASLRWHVVTQLARSGLADDALVDAELATDDTITGAEQAAGARAARPGAAAKEAAWVAAVESDELPNETQKRICLSFWQRGQAAVLSPYVERYLRAAEDISAARGIWATKGFSLRRNVLVGLFPQPEPGGTEAFLDRLDEWLAGTELADSVLRVVRERRDDTVRALRCQQRASTG